MQPDSEPFVLIGVTGSIAIIRSCDLVRNLTKSGIPVQVVMTRNATEFIRPLTFEALSNRPVFVEEYGSGMPHIDLKKSAKVFAIVPATANTIAKFAQGIADDLMTSTYLAIQCPVLVAPAMNPGMYSHPATQRNLQQLTKDGVEILDPSQGEVVCGDIGKGKLAELSLIESRIRELYSISSKL